MSKISFRRRFRLPRNRPQCYPIRESSEEEEEARRHATANREAADPGIKRMMSLLLDDGGKYTSDEEDEAPEVKKRPKQEEKRPEQVVKKNHVPAGRQVNRRGREEKGVVREADGGVYTSDEEEEPPKSAELSKRPPPKPKKRSPEYEQISKRFRFLLLRAVANKEAHRFKLYARLTLFPPAQLSKFRVGETIDCLLDVVATMPTFSFYCAEFLHKQMTSLPPGDQKLFRTVVTRRVLGRFMGDGYYWLPLKEKRHMKFIYSSLFAYLYLVLIVPAKVVKRTINRLFQTNNFEAERIAFFDPDSVVYAARILKHIGAKFDSGSEGQQKQMDKWWTHLARMEGGPPVVLADVRSLLALRVEGSWCVDGHGRLDDFEFQQAGDDVVLNANNNYGRRLYCSREILSLYSPFFHRIFSSRRGCTKLVELNMDVEYYMLREILNVIYHVNRDFINEDLGYDLPLLMEMYSMAEKFDFPLIKRMVVEQAEEEPAVKVAQMAYPKGFIDITSKALKRMDEEEVEQFMMICDLEGTMKMQDIVTVLEKLWPPFFRVSRNDSMYDYEEEEVEEEEEVDAMFPSDFGSEWPLYDVVIHCQDVNDRVLYANSTMLATFSHAFRRFMGSSRPKNGVPIKVSLNLNYNAVKAILRIIHHVNRRFGNLPSPNVSPWMIGQVLEAGYHLEMPLVLKMMDDVLDVYSRERLLQAAVIEHVPASDLTPGRYDEDALCLLIHKAVIKRLKA